MKKAFLLSATALLLAACGTTTPPNATTSSLTALSGTVSGWNRGPATLELAVTNDATGAPVVVGGGAVAADGKVSGALPSGDALTAYLAPFTQLNPPAQTNCTGQLTFSDSAAHYSLLNQLHPKANGQSVGSIVPGLVSAANSSTTAGSGEYQMLLYADRPTSVSGTSTCPKDSLTFNAQLKQGWNALRVQVSGATSGTSGVNTIQLTSADSLSTTWTLLPTTSAGSRLAADQALLQRGQ